MAVRRIITNRAKKSIRNGNDILFGTSISLPMYFLYKKSHYNKKYLEISEKMYIFAEIFYRLLY